MKRKRITGNLPDMITQAQKMGYTHVLTFGGPVPLREWKPYSHTIPPIDFEMVENELLEKNPNGSWLGEYTVLGVWPLCKMPLICFKCGKQIRRGSWVRRIGKQAIHGACS